MTIHSGRDWPACRRPLIHAVYFLKKPGATECGLYRKISLLSEITKILLRIIMMRVRNKIKPEIAHEQCDFAVEKNKTIAAYILRTINQRALDVQKEV